MPNAKMSVQPPDNDDDRVMLSISLPVKAREILRRLTLARHRELDPPLTPRQRAEQHREAQRAVSLAEKRWLTTTEAGRIALMNGTALALDEGHRKGREYMRERFLTANPSFAAAPVGRPRSGKRFPLIMGDLLGEALALLEQQTANREAGDASKGTETRRVVKLKAVRRQREV